MPAPLAHHSSRAFIFWQRSQECGLPFAHGFIKKTRATPNEDIDLAARRWRNWNDTQEK
jgi:phage-related protein